ncbi:MAG: AAA family ATPase [Trueperaceae bacterium]
MSHDIQSLDSPSPAYSTNIDKFEEVLESLHPDIQDLTLEHLTEELQEIRIVKGYKLEFKLGDATKRIETFTVEAKHVTFTRDKIGGFRSDWRAGINGTLHRYAGMPNRYDTLVGISIRLARAIPNIAEPLRPYLNTANSFMLVGRPGTGKTSVLRDIVRILGEGCGQLCVAVDTSNEIGGDGDIPHPAIGNALRIQVGEPSRQGEVLRMVIANLTPLKLIVDEIGYHGNDVIHIESCARRGVGVGATLHGSVLADVLENKAFLPLLGNVDLQFRKRITTPVFQMALELRSRDEWVVYPNLADAVDALLEQREPEGIQIKKPGRYET